MDQRVISNHALLNSALAGLRASPKTLDSKWFYDTEGSRLFEKITQLAEYYPTRTETAILTKYADELSTYCSEGGALVELGSGASVKTKIVLDAMQSLSSYLPVDIAEEFLYESARDLAVNYPSLAVRPVVADFTKPFDLPLGLIDVPKSVFFPGSTIGNLSHDEAVDLLSHVRSFSNVEMFILGADLVKSEDILVPAYDDASGVTADFNLNLLTRLNREVGADFDRSAFEHVARWNAVDSRIEMHLVSKTQQVVNIAGNDIHFQKDETIHTENSRKYTPDSLEKIAQAASWKVEKIFTDENDYFAVAVLLPV